MPPLTAPQPQRPIGAATLAHSLLATSSEEAAGPDDPSDSSRRRQSQAGDDATEEEEDEERVATLKGRKAPSDLCEALAQQDDEEEEDVTTPGLSTVGPKAIPGSMMADTRRGSDARSSARSSLTLGHHSGPTEHNLALSQLAIPPSPSCSVASSYGGGSQSDYEPLDSPSSLSSWNSFVAPGVRRGDLADVEDLELDAGHEPELETVSECDEESSSFASGSDRLGGPSGADSDLDEATTHSSLNAGNLGQHGLGFDHINLRRLKNGREHQSRDHLLPPDNRTQNGHQQHVQAPNLPHFSPRNGGHGLSHFSRHSSRAPPNLAARRRKGRLAELAEEGAGAEISSTTPPPVGSTVMPSPGESTPRRPSGDMSTPGVLAGRRRSTSRSKSLEVPAQRSTSGSSAGSLGGAEDAPPGSTSPTTPTPTTFSTSWSEFEFVGPPALPPRCVSPSETVPAVPSPLCEVVATAGEDSVSSLRDVTPSVDASTETICASSSAGSLPGPSPLSHSTPREEDHGNAVQSSDPPSPSSSRPSTASERSHAVTLGDSSTTAHTSPPSSPVQASAALVRKGSRGRRSSSPTRPKPVVPLRPCFRRRTSAQSAHLPSRGGRDSSSERESVSSVSRGRAHVRFSPAPPQELRTHSPVEYDRKACAVSNRLSPEDVEELREMHMEMGLLEAKWAAMAACKQRSAGASSCSEDEGAATETETEGEDDAHSQHNSHRFPGSPNRPYGYSQQQQQHLLTPPRPDGPAERKRADSIATSSPSSFCRDRFDGSSSPAHQTPAEHLREERERALRYAGIGTGAGFRFNWGAPGAPAGRTQPRPELGMCQRPAGANQGAVNPLIARFGLSKPPPPLPGTTVSAPASTSNSPSPPTFAHELASAAVMQGSSAQRDFSAGSTASNRTVMGNSGARSDSWSPDRARGTSGPSLRRAHSPAHLSGPAFVSRFAASPAPDDVYASASEAGEEDDEVPRGRATHVGSHATISSAPPSLVHTSPSPPTSPTKSAQLTSTALSGANRQPPPVFAPTSWASRTASSSTYRSNGSTCAWSNRSGYSTPASTPGTPSTPCGYDSPASASEFYESGSEYDLIG